MIGSSLAHAFLKCCGLLATVRYMNVLYEIFFFLFIFKISQSALK